MPQAHYIMIGGFLGAGKTTAILRLAAALKAKGKRVGLITNDQSIDLVDTARAKAAGFNVEEITGGCFCCKFDSLVEASLHLTKENAPDVLIAEPVGSCTDLKATVSYPLQQLYGDQYRVAPLSVLVDPKRATAVLGLTPGKQFSEKVVYVYRKQLEEAEIIVIHKADTLSPAEREQLAAALRAAFPPARVLIASSVTGEGVEPWHASLLAGELGQAATMEVDYDTYAEGEALLGWVNIKGQLAGAGDFDGNALLLSLAEKLKRRLGSQSIEVAHLKMTLAPDRGNDLGAVSLTRSDEQPAATHRLAAPLGKGELMVNLRAEAAPELLKEQTLAELATLKPLTFTLQHVAAFRPGRPTPTHRVKVEA